MKRIRIGKDISMRWEITTDGVAIPLEGRDLTIEIKSPAGIGNNIPYRVDGNVLIMTFYGYEQKRTGEYSITLWENKGKIGQNVVDVVRAFELVRTSQEENDFVGGDLQIESVDLGTENFDILTEGGYRAINIDTLQAEALEDSVNIKGKTYSNESFTITLPKANLDSAGVMSASDVRTLKDHADSIAQIKTTLDEHTESINARITTDRIEDGAVTIGKLEPSIQSLITNISKNASFAGIATPTTNPGTPNGSVFYIATQAGTYSNFGDIKVANGEAAILQWRNGVWVKAISGLATTEAIQAETTRATIAEQSNAQAIATKENLTNKVTSISADADDDHYPSAKAVLDTTDGMVNGYDIIGEKISLTYTSGSTYTIFEVGLLPKGTTIRIWLDKVIGGQVGDECNLSVYCNTTAAENAMVNKVPIILGKESSYIDCTTVIDTTVLVVSGNKVGSNPWGTSITYAVVTHEDAKVPSIEKFNQLKKDIDSAHTAINAAITDNADDITDLKNAQVNLSEYVSGEDYGGSIHHVIHEFNSEGRMTFNAVGPDNLNKWYIYDAAKIGKTGVELKKFYVEYMKGNASVIIFVGVFAKTSSGFKLKYKLYSEDVKEHTGSTYIPSETGTGYGNNSAEYQSVERYVLAKGDYIGFTPRNGWMCGYIEEKDGAYVLTDSGDGVNFTAAKTNIFCALKFDTTDVAGVQVGELLTKNNAKKSVNMLPALVNRAKRYNCTSDTKILLLGDSISSDTMMGGNVSEHNYNGFQIALSELLNIPPTNIIRGGMPGLGVGWFSGDGAWKNNGDKSVVACNPDIIISIVGANDNGSRWTVGTFSGEIEGEPIVKDLDFTTESSQGTYGSQGFTHFIQGVSWVVQRYLNTYYDIRSRAGVTDDDTVESADEKMAAVKIPKLIICTTLPQNRTGNTESSNPENWKRKRDAIIEVCNKYKIECVDLLSAMPWDPTKEPSFSSAEWKNKGIYTMDGLHPNSNGFRVIAGLICAGAGLIKA